MRRNIEEVARKNEEQILALRRENEAKKRKFIEGGPSVVPTNLVGRSFTSPPNPKTTEETKDKVCMIGTSNSVCRHPFTDSIIGVPLSNKWKGFNRDRCDGTIDPYEHMDAYTTHMSLYTSNDTVLC